VGFPLGGDLDGKIQDGSRQEGALWVRKGATRESCGRARKIHYKGKPAKGLRLRSRAYGPPRTSGLTPKSPGKKREKGKVSYVKFQEAKRLVPGINATQAIEHKKT